MRPAPILLVLIIAASTLAPAAISGPAGYAAVVNTPGSNTAYSALTLPDGTLAVSGVACDADAFIAFTDP